MKATTLNANFLISEYQKYLDSNNLRTKKKEKLLKNFKIEMFDSVIDNTNQIFERIKKINQKGLSDDLTEVYVEMQLVQKYYQTACEKINKI